jgi:hypothetical protein
MKSNRWVAIAVAIVVVVAVLYLVRRGGPDQAVDLLTRYDEATKAPPDKFLGLEDVEIDGETRRSVVTHAASRLTFRVQVPDDAWLRVALAMRPDVWEKEGNGVLFRVGVSDGRTYDELVKQHLNPSGRPNDRHWVPLFIDLSVYAGEEVEIILNTNTTLDGQPDDPRNDIALWGSPEIVIR